MEDTPQQVEPKSKQTKQQSLYQMSLVLYPYYFQQRERKSWVQMKSFEKERIARPRQTPVRYRSFIMIKRLNQGKQLTKVQECWVVNKGNLQVLGRFEGQPDNVDLESCQESKRMQTSSKCCAPSGKIENLLFVGRCRFANRSITIEDSKVSQKHILLEKVEDPLQANGQQYFNNLMALCIQGTLKSSARLFSMLSALTADLLNTITSFVGRPSQNRYFVWDNSTNGTLMRLSPTINMADHLEQEIRVCERKQRFNFRVVCILKSGRLTTLSSRLTQIISSLGNAIKIVNRKLNLEDEKKYQNISVMILEVKEYNKTTVYVMYSEEIAYFLVKRNYNLEVQSEGIGQSESLGKIQCFEGWVLKVKEDRKLYKVMVRNKKYEIKDAVELKLSQATGLIIQTCQNE